MRPVTPVGILAAKLESLAEQVEKIDNLDRAFKAELQQAYELANGLDPYLDLCTTPESPALATLVKRTQSEDWSKRFSDGETVRQLEQEMLSGHLERPNAEISRPSHQSTAGTGNRDVYRVLSTSDGGSTAGGWSGGSLRSRCLCS